MRIIQENSGNLSGHRSCDVSIEGQRCLRRRIQEPPVEVRIWEVSQGYDVWFAPMFSLFSYTFCANRHRRSIFTRADCRTKLRLVV